MPPQTASPTTPVPSRRLAMRMRKAMHKLRDDNEANATAMGGLIIGYIVTVFVSIILFTQLGPDVNTICTDTTNFTAEDCQGAKDTRTFFWTILVVFGIAVLIALLAMAGVFKAGGSPSGGGGRRRRR